MFSPYGLLAPFIYGTEQPQSGISTLHLNEESQSDGFDNEPNEQYQHKQSPIVEQSRINFESSQETDHSDNQLSDDDSTESEGTEEINALSTLIRHYTAVINDSGSNEILSSTEVSDCWETLLVEIECCQHMGEFVDVVTILTNMIPSLSAGNVLRNKNMRRQYNGLMRLNVDWLSSCGNFDDLTYEKIIEDIIFPCLRRMEKCIEDDVDAATEIDTSSCSSSPTNSDDLSENEREINKRVDCLKVLEQLRPELINSLEDRDIVLIIGGTGSGKSTLVQLMNGAKPRKKGSR